MTEQELADAGFPKEKSISTFKDDEREYYSFELDEPVNDKKEVTFVLVNGKVETWDRTDIDTFVHHIHTRALWRRIFGKKLDL